jgi:hypothetical protein
VKVIKGVKGEIESQKNKCEGEANAHFARLSFCAVVWEEHETQLREEIGSSLHSSLPCCFVDTILLYRY